MSEYDLHFKNFEDSLQDDIVLTETPLIALPIQISGKEAELLEHYAGLAMQAIINNIETLKNDEDYNHDAVAVDAFEFAFAMMRRRNEYNR